MNKKMMALFGLLLVLGIVAAIYLNRPEDATAFEFNWPEGNEYVYKLSYQNKNVTSILASMADEDADGEQSFEATTDFEAKLVLRSYGKQGDYFLLGARLEEFEKHALNFMGTDVFPDDAAVQKTFAGQEAFIEIGADGRIERFKFSKKSPALFKNILQTLLSETQIVIEKGSQAWETVEKNQNGVAPADYEFLKDQGLRLEKKRTKYSELYALSNKTQEIGPEVSAAYSSELSADGHIDSIEGKERISAEDSSKRSIVDLETTVSLKLLETRRASTKQSRSVLLSNTESRKPGELVISEEGQRRGLVQRVAGLTYEDLKTSILQFGNSGRMPFKSKWIWRSVGLLRLHPEYCAKLEEIFKDETMETEGKALILDLLASTGHKEAQHSLLNMLKSPEAVGDEKYFLLLQRVTLLKEPKPETAAWMHDFFKKSKESDEGDNLTHFASAYSLGAVTNALKEQGFDEQSDAMNKTLREALREAETPKEKSAYIAGLGETRRDENVDLIADFAGDENGKVRRSVASALRHNQTERSEEIIMTFTEDSSGLVQGSAIETLKDYDVRNEHLEHLQTVFDKGVVQSRNYARLSGLLRNKGMKNDENRDTAVKIYESMLEKDLGSKLRHQIRGTLDKHKPKE
ncbi:MAG: HEAT repeat domain-containing protein [Deltaproteobacteria bacterium]|nr:HEAT repeat domain-containing protein [Deltaproteobacteria bacterium]